jgi:uncharacterized protein
MKLDKKILFSFLLLIIFISIAVNSKASTLTDIDTTEILQQEYETSIDDYTLEKVLPEETSNEFDEITSVENGQIENTYNQESYNSETLNVTNESTMTQFERGRLNSKVPMVDISLKVYDYANLFTESEEKKLYEEINSFIQQNNMDMAVVTISDNPYYYARDYADDFYDYNEFGKNEKNDGVLFLIDMDTREMWISTTGAAINRLNDREIDRILDECYNQITNKKYFNCASEFIEYTGIYIKSSGSQMVFAPRFKKTQVYAGVGGGVLVGIIYLLIGRSKHKLIQRQNQAHNYENKLKLTTNSDILVHHRVHRIYSPITESSSSSIGSGGGSSIHIGSSGISHGGGGRHF